MIIVIYSNKKNHPKSSKITSLFCQESGIYQRGRRLQAPSRRGVAAALAEGWRPQGVESTAVRKFCTVTDPRDPNGCQKRNGKWGKWTQHEVGRLTLQVTRLTSSTSKLEIICKRPRYRWIQWSGWCNVSVTFFLTWSKRGFGAKESHGQVIWFSHKGEWSRARSYGFVYIYIHCKDSHYRMVTIFIIFHHHLGNLTLAHVFSPWDKTKSCSPKLESWWAPNLV
jgi:hypothetical protein